jgi:hypothetical protein
MRYIEQQNPHTVKKKVYLGCTIEPFQWLLPTSFYLSLKPSNDSKLHCWNTKRRRRNKKSGKKISSSKLIHKIFSQKHSFSILDELAIMGHSNST